MNEYFSHIKQEIENHPDNAVFTQQGWEPLFSGSQKSKLIIIGQAPGIHAQSSNIPWDDKSGETLRQWLGITDEQFYDDDIVALIPMDFYYPGKGKTGDLPPRKDFAEKWHPQILDHIQEGALVILIGQYSQNYYLQDRERTLTETVRNFKKYTPNNFFPLPHPSPRNNIWMAKNPWFKADVLPELQHIVNKSLK